MNQPLLILTLTAAACTALPAATVLPPGEYVLTGAMQTLEGNRGAAGFPDTGGAKYSSTTTAGTDRTAVIALSPTSTDFYLNYPATALDINGAATGTGLAVATYRYVEIHYTLSAAFTGSTQQLRLDTTGNAAAFDTFTGSGSIPATAGTHSIVIDLLSNDGSTLNGTWSGEWELLRWDFWNNTGNEGKSFTIDKVVYAPSVVRRMLDRPAAVVMDAGGGRATGGTVVNDGSLGGIVGISSAVATVAKHGYIGQLYDVTGLMLNAATTNVNEGATLQLGAWQSLDDATFLAVPAASVTWSTVSGPLSISSGGLATGGAVYQNTSASAQGSYLGQTGTLGLTVVNVNLDNFGAYAGDGLGDDWQVQYFGQPPNANAGPLVDFDGDGQTNAFEFTAGLVPNDPASRFKLNIAPVPGEPEQMRLVFSPRLTDRTYTVKAKPSLLTGTFTALGSSSFTDNAQERTVTDLNASGATKFYQVEITKP